MRFCRTRLSAKRFIADVGGNALAPLSTDTPSNAGPPAVAPSVSLPIMRWATSHTASIALTISCLPTTTSSSRHSRIDQCRIGLFENAEQRQSGLSRHDVLSLGNQKALLLQSADDLGSRRWRANALGFLQALPKNLIVNKTPGILHCLDQSAFVVAWRRSGLLVLNFGILQLCGLAVAQWRQQLRFVLLRAASP